SKRDWSSDVCSSDLQTSEQPFELLDDRIDVDDLRLQHLPASEGEELSRQRGAAFGGAVNLFEVVAHRIVARDLFEHQIAVAENRSEERRVGKEGGVS